MLNVVPLIGKKATKEEVLKRIGSVALVHIAAHGNMENGEIALAPNPSRASKIPEEKDFILKMADVRAAKLRARLVVVVAVTVHKVRLRVRVWPVLQGLSWVLVLAQFWCRSGKLMTRQQWSL